MHSRTRAERPERSILFLAVTLEESGLLGSAYYVDNPLFPLAQTVAVSTWMPCTSAAPRATSRWSTSAPRSSRTICATAAKAQGSRHWPEPTPERGFSFRSDHFNFAKRGVPALYIKSGMDDREHGRAYGQQQQEDYVAKRYHQPSDEYSKDLDLSGSFQDLELMYRVGERVAGEKSWPEWYKNSEFRAVREKSDDER